MDFRVKIIKKIQHDNMVINLRKTSLPNAVQIFLIITLN